MNLRYLLLRLARHFMPESVARFLLKKRWIIRPGLESSDPHAAVEQYLAELAELGITIKGKRVLVFGYGGRFAVGAELLAQGAAHVVLSDHFVLLDHQRNLELMPKYEKFLQLENSQVIPNPAFITLLHADILQKELQSQILPVDLVLSTSVYEHLEQVAEITAALARLTSPDGVQLHFVDLRDHYFKFPFEMLAYPEWFWKKMLNPTSNLNRFRLPAYQKIFEENFNHTKIHVLARAEVEFMKMRKRIRPEFISGDPSIDTVTLIAIIAEHPRHTASLPTIPAAQ